MPGGGWDGLANSEGALAGLRVLDLSRVLAGPWCAQILGDLGADVLKVEAIGVGDDTRHWGPPFIEDGSDHPDAAYYTVANRNKRSLALDIGQPDGLAVAKELAARADVIVENFKVGSLARRGLDYAAVGKGNPGLVYCSITGFGQTGPYASRGGYDFLIQGMSGLMSVTGRPDGAPGSGPMKAGVAVSDLFAGLYAAIAILAALNHRAATGIGQYIDTALLDSQITALVNQNVNWLVGGEVPRSLGNQHPNVVPYQDFAALDGTILIACGNDRQFADLARVLGQAELAEDLHFSTSAARSVNRLALIATLEPLVARRTVAELSAALEGAGVPAGPVNRIDQALSDPQVAARGLVKKIVRADGTAIPFIGFPPRLSATPASYRRAPPALGQDTQWALSSVLGRSQEQISAFIERRIVGMAADSNLNSEMAQ